MASPNTAIQLLFRCLLLAGFLAGGIAYGQIQRRGFVFKMELGPSWQNVDAINQVLTKRRFPELSGALFNFGVGFELHGGRWVFDPTLYEFSSERKQEGLKRSGLDYHKVLLRGGYQFGREDSPFRLYPAVGFGWGKAILELRPEDISDRQRYNATGLFGEFSLGTHWYLMIDDPKSYYALITFRVGYQTGFGVGWETLDVVKGTVTDLSPNTFFVKVGFGMGTLK